MFPQIIQDFRAQVIEDTNPPPPLYRNVSDRSRRASSTVEMVDTDRQDIDDAAQKVNCMVTGCDGKDQTLQKHREVAVNVSAVSPRPELDGCTSMVSMLSDASTLT